MGCKDLLLLLQYACHFLLKCKELLLILASHCSLHCVDVLSYFFLVLVSNHVLDLYLFLNLLRLFYGGNILWWWYGLFYGICSIFIFIFFGVFCNLFNLFNLFYLFCLFYLLHLFYFFQLLSFFDLLLGLFHNGGLFLLIRTLRWNFILYILWLKDLFDVLQIRVIIRRIAQAFRWPRTFLFLNSLSAFDLMNITSSFFLYLYTILTLCFARTLIFSLYAVINLVVFFTQLSLVLQSL